MKVITLTDEQYDQVLYKLEQAMYHLEPNDDPYSTNFSYCVSCQQVEYLAHEDDCAAMKILKILKDNTK